mgnify:FL=1
MKEDEFLDTVGIYLHEYSMENRPVVAGYISFTINEKGIVTSSFVDGKKHNLGDDSGILEYHERRYAFNLDLQSYHAALYHLHRIVEVRIGSIEKKYCSV